VLTRLAEVGEPEAAGIVEDNVVWAVQLAAITRIIKRLDLAGLGIDVLDRAALVGGGLGAGE
jgi:hypothetical protein